MAFIPSTPGSFRQNRPPLPLGATAFRCGLIGTKIVKILCGLFDQSKSLANPAQKAKATPNNDGA